MTQVVNNDKLELKLTGYGLSRIDYAMEHPDVVLALTKIKIGSGKDNEYYVPTEGELLNPDFDLQGPIEGYEFYIQDKELLEDELTVSFHAVITEDIGGFEIREVGLYESTEEGDKLFAIATQQPFIKPSPQDNYFISLNYYIFLKAQNFANLYDRITLDIEHATVSEPDLEALMKTFLFAQENLMVQIGKNTELLGYNRPTQLLEKINENRTNYSYITLYKNFASVLDLVESADDIFSYWIFDYSRRESLGKSITDLSNNKNYLSTNKISNLYPHSFEGFQSFFNFRDNDYYELSPDIPLDLYDSSTGKDSPFTIAFVVKPNSYNETRTILAKSDQREGQMKVLEIQEMEDNSLRVKMYSNNESFYAWKYENALAYTKENPISSATAEIYDSNFEPIEPDENGFHIEEYNSTFVLKYGEHNTEYSEAASKFSYIIFQTNKGVIPKRVHSVVLTYDPEERIMKTFIDSEGYSMSIIGGERYTHMDTSVGGTFYEYEYLPTIGVAVDTGLNEPVPDTNPLVFDDDLDKTIYCNLDGGTIYSPDSWYTDKYLDLYFEDVIADVKGTLYAWTFNDKIIYTKVANLNSRLIILYNENFERIDQSRRGFHIEQEGANFVMKYGDDPAEYTEEQNIPYSPTAIPLYAWVYRASVASEPKIIYTKTETITEDTTLYNSAYNVVGESSDEFHIVFDGSDYQIVYGDDPNPATLNNSYSKTRYVYTCVCPSNVQSIYTITNDLKGVGYPLYTLTDGVFLKYSGSAWTIQSKSTGDEVTYALFYNDNEATLMPNPIVSPAPPLSSYIMSSSGQMVDPINSKVGLISIIKEELSDANARVLALTLCATVGQNPFLGGD